MTKTQQYNRDYYLKHKKSINKRALEYYYANKDKQSAYYKSYYQAHKDKIAKQTREYYEAHREYYKGYYKAYHKFTRGNKATETEGPRIQGHCPHCDYVVSYAALEQCVPTDVCPRCKQEAVQSFLLRGI